MSMFMVVVVMVMAMTTAERTKQADGGGTQQEEQHIAVNIRHHRVRLESQSMQDTQSANTR